MNTATLDVSCLTCGAKAEPEQVPLRKDGYFEYRNTPPCDCPRTPNEATIQVVATYGTWKP